MVIAFALVLALAACGQSNWKPTEAELKTAVEQSTGKEYTSGLGSNVDWTILSPAQSDSSSEQSGGDPVSVILALTEEGRKWRSGTRGLPKTTTFRERDGVTFIHIPKGLTEQGLTLLESYGLEACVSAWVCVGSNLSAPNPLEKVPPDFKRVVNDLKVLAQ